MFVVYREATEKEKQRVDKVLKDIDLKKGPRHFFRLSPSRRALLVHAIEDDSKFLEQHCIMDYSMLIGVKRKMMSEEDELNSRIESNIISYSPFRCDDGGFATTGPTDPDTEVLFLGIIDILQPFNMRKKVERTFKQVILGTKQEISAEDPVYYGQRFRRFLRSVIVEGNKVGSGRPQTIWLHTDPFPVHDPVPTEPPPDPKPSILFESKHHVVKSRLSMAPLESPAKLGSRPKPSSPPRPDRSSKQLPPDPKPKQQQSPPRPKTETKPQLSPQPKSLPLLPPLPQQPPQLPKPEVKAKTEIKPTVTPQPKALPSPPQPSNPEPTAKPEGTTKVDSKQLPDSKAKQQSTEQPQATAPSRPQRPQQKRVSPYPRSQSLRIPRSKSQMSVSPVASRYNPQPYSSHRAPPSTPTDVDKSPVRVFPVDSREAPKSPVQESKPAAEPLRLPGLTTPDKKPTATTPSASSTATPVKLDTPTRASMPPHVMKPLPSPGSSAPDVKARRAVPPVPPSPQQQQQSLSPSRSLRVSSSQPVLPVKTKTEPTTPSHGSQASLQQQPPKKLSTPSRQDSSRPPAVPRKPPVPPKAEPSANPEGSESKPLSAPLLEQTAQQQQQQPRKAPTPSRQDPSQQVPPAVPRKPPVPPKAEPSTNPEGSVSKPPPPIPSRMNRK